MNSGKTTQGACQANEINSTTQTRYQLSALRFSISQSKNKPFGMVYGDIIARDDVLSYFCFAIRSDTEESMTQGADVFVSDVLRESGPIEEPMPIRRHFFVRRLHLESYLGLCGWERASTQPITIDLEYVLSERAMSEHAPDGGYTALPGTLNVAQQLRSFVLEGHYDLVEAMAEGIANMLFARFDVTWLLLTVTKRRTFPSTEVGFTIERGALSC